MQTFSNKESLLAFRSTTPSDVAFVIQAERHPENAPYIGQWSQERHREAIASQNEAHFILEVDTQPVGYLILTGKTEGHDAIHIKRIVITQKGKGYGRAALRWVKVYVFETLGFHRLWFDVIASNERAKALYLSEGFTVEGTMRDSWKSAEGYEDMLLLSMLDFDYARSSLDQAPTVEAPTVEAPTVEAPTVQALTVQAPTGQHLNELSGT